MHNLYYLAASASTVQNTRPIALVLGVVFLAGALVLHLVDKVRGK